MTVHDSAPFVTWGFQPMDRGDDLQRRVRFGKTKFRHTDNLLICRDKMPGPAELVFPHLTRRRTRGSPVHGLEGRATKMQWCGITHAYLAATSFR